MDRDCRSDVRRTDEGLVRQLPRRVEILKFGEAAAWTYGALFAQLRSRGEPIGVLDSMIAAHAMTAQRVLVTNNTSHFTRVEGMRLEDWF